MRTRSRTIIVGGGDCKDAESLGFGCPKDGLGGDRWRSPRGRFIPALAMTSLTKYVFERVLHSHPPPKA
jgi:hypothetical protein